MRFMMIVKASRDSEAGRMPTERELAGMGRYNQALADAGALLAGEGLHPSSRGVRVRFSAGRPTVTEGPFPDPEQLVAGFWIIQAASRDEAVEWARKIPFGEGEVEVRQVLEAEDFGDELTPELREQEDRLRERLGGQEG